MPEAICRSGKAKIDQLHNVWNKMVADAYRRGRFTLEDNLFDDTENKFYTKAIGEDKRPDGRKNGRTASPLAKLEEFLRSCMARNFYRGGRMLSVLTLGGVGR